MDLEPALQGITADRLMRHVGVLASDEFEGRAPGTRGEALTVDYLTKQFEEIGLAPGNPDGTYVQEVPLVGFTSRPTAAFEAGGRPLDVEFPRDYVAGSRRPEPEVTVGPSELVFVGYGVEAPEYGWDDFKGADLRGKTLVMLIGDPYAPDPSSPTGVDEAFFKGRAMTYYGRWTYKYEKATELGAAAAIIVHETRPAGYPYDVVIRSWARENFDVEGSDPGRVAVEGWIHLDRARELFAAGGHDFDALKEAALGRDFRPVALGATASFRVENALREVRSRNVLARLEGADPALRDEHVIYTAHWDHLGRDASLGGDEGDQIFSGAVDNATGVAALLEIARAFRALPEPPRRSVLFVATTAEESGLLGAKYYAANPMWPLEGTVANVNMDMMNPWGRTRDVQVLGLGASTLDEVTAAAAASQGRVLTGDAEPEKGLFYRSDHFELMRAGVPALYTKVGMDFLGKPAGWGRAKRDEFTHERYHKVTDVVTEDWDLSGTVEDARLLFEVGYRVARSDDRPAWKPGAEFGRYRVVGPRPPVLSPRVSARTED
jgi:Zn-dependent M28 family amino/carboxypeptidase